MAARRHPTDDGLLLTRLAVRRPVTTLMACIIVALLGVASVSRLPVDLMPNTGLPRIAIRVAYEGAGPREIETLVTRPLEETLMTVQGVQSIQSTSHEGSCLVFVDVQWGTNTGNTIHEIQRAIANNQQSFPEEIDPPNISRYDPADYPIVWLRIKSDRDPIPLTQYIDNHVVPRLERIRGVARVRFDGAVRREIQVDLDRGRLQTRGISIEEVVVALKRENAIHRAGDVRRGRFRVLVRTQAAFEKLDDIAKVVVRKRGDAVIHVGDVGEVVDGHEPQTLIMRMDGQPSMALLIYKQSDMNTVAVSDAVRDAVDEFNAQNHEAQLAVRSDAGDPIRLSIANVRRTLLLGMVLAGVVLMAFLRSVPSTFVIALSMPISVLATLVLLYFCGLTLNMVSFGGLALGIGLLVDNSIVVLESILRKRGEGCEAKQAAIAGTSEVAAAITASTITTLVVFVPLVFIDGPSGVLLHQLAFVVSMALLSSLLMSVTVTPVLTTLWRNVPRSNPRTRHDRLERGYAPVLGFCLRRPGLVTAGLLAAFCCSLGLTPLIGSELMPKSDGGVVRVDGVMEPGIQIGPLRRQVEALESELKKRVPEAETIYSRMGGMAEASGYYHRFTCLVHLVRDESRRSSEEIAEDLKRTLPPAPGVKHSIWSYNTRSGFETLHTLGKAGLQFEVRGDDPDTLEHLADAVAEAIRPVPGIANVRVNKEDRREALLATIDRDKAGALGVSVNDVASVVESEIRGTDAGLYRQGGDEFNVVVRMCKADRSTPSDVGRVGVAGTDDRIVPIRSLTRVSPVHDVATISRIDQQRAVVVSANVEGRDLGGTVADVRRKLARVTAGFPQGYSVNLAGDWKRQQQSFRALRIGLLMALALTYMVMASQFESLRDPLLILITVPLGAIGVVLALVLTGTTLNVQSFIGIVMLSGIVVNNAIVLIDYMNQLRRADPNLPIDDVVRLAAVRRFRPILMTTITTVLAMFPIALGWGEGGEIQAPMARVVIGGLTSCTLITLVAIPLAYRWTRGEPAGFGAGDWSLGAGTDQRHYLSNGEPLVADRPSLISSPQPPVPRPESPRT